MSKKKKILIVSIISVLALAGVVLIMSPGVWNSAEGLGQSAKAHSNSPGGTSQYQEFSVVYVEENSTLTDGAQTAAFRERAEAFDATLTDIKFESVLAEVTTVIYDGKSFTQKFNVPNNGSDLYIFGIQDGALGSVEIFNPFGMLVKRIPTFYSDRPTIIRDARKGNWKIKTTPYPDSIKYDQKVNIRFSIRTIPTFQELSLPEYTREQAVSVEINGAQTVTNKRNGSTLQDGKLALEEGDNEIENRSNYGYGEVKWSRIICDTSAPEISIWGMTGDEITFPNSELVLEGSIDEAATVYVNGQKAELSFSCVGGLPFSKKLRLQRGENTIVVKAVDNVGNTSTKEIRIIYE